MSNKVEKMRRGIYGMESLRKTTWASTHRKIKIVVCSTCFFICMYQLVEFLIVYFAFPTSVDAEVLTDRNTEVPAITICYNNDLLYKILCQTKSNSYCDLHSMSNFENQAYVVTRDEARVKMIKECKFRYMNNSDDVLTPEECQSAWVFNGQEPCVVINVDWGNNSLRNKSSYAEFMYSVDTFVEQPQNQRIQGMDIFLHSPQVYPTREIRSFFISPNALYKASFKKTIVNRLERPYKTNCFNYSKISEFNDIENNFEVSQEACYHSCLLTYLNSSCGCIPTTNAFHEGYYACNRSEKQTCQPLLKDGLTERDEICKDRCPIGCHTEYYEYSITKLYDFAKRESDRLRIAEVYHELRGNVVVIFNHKPQISPVEIFSNIGGYLGIWLGMSVPLLYDMFVRLLVDLYKHYVKRKTPPSSSTTNNREMRVISTSIMTRQLRSNHAPSSRHSPVRVN